MRQAMTGKATRSVKRLDELDAIVVSIVEAFESDGGESGDERLDSRVRHLRQPSHQGDKASALRKDAPSARRSMEKPLAADEMMCPPDPEAEPEMGMIEEAESLAMDPSLFTGDDQEFVSRTVDWLSARPNADIILDHIWTLVVERTSGRPSADHQKMDDGSKQTPAASDPGETSGEPENG